MAVEDVHTEIVRLLDYANQFTEVIFISLLPRDERRFAYEKCKFLQEMLLSTLDYRLVGTIGVTMNDMNSDRIHLSADGASIIPVYPYK